MTDLLLRPIANDDPPCFLSFTDTAGSTELNNLYLIIPNKDINPPIPPSYNPGPSSVTAPSATEPVWEGSSRAEKESRMFYDSILIAEDSIMTVFHSGGTPINSYGDYILVAYASNEATPGNVGTNQYVVVVSRSTRQILRRVYVGRSETIPGPDNHDQPSIVIDSKGVAHVVFAGHHTNVWHVYSTSSDYSSWSEPEQFGYNVTVGTDGGYTYTALICDSQDRLHTVHRSAKVGYEFSLGYNRRNADGTWEYPSSDLKVVDVDRSFYTIWYHKLMLGKNDELYLTFSPLYSQMSANEITYYNELFPGELPFWWPPYQSTGWSNESNVTASDNTYATSVLAAGAISRELQATNFGFSIPGGDVIEGILFEVERKASAGSVIHYASWALKAGVPVGEQLFTGDWAIAEGTDSSGGASDLHGTTWTPSQINATTFGFRLSGKSLGLASTLSVDHMQVTVYTDNGTYGPNSPGTMGEYEPGIASGQRAHGSCTIMSIDGGDTWNLADQADL